MIIKRKNNINSFPKDFFEDSSNSSKKYHPKIINPANTINKPITITIIIANFVLFFFFIKYPSSKIIA